MLRAVGLNAAARRDVVLQAWLSEEAEARRDVVLQAEACADRPLPRGADAGLVGSLQDTMQVVVGVERRIDGDFGCYAETAVECPRPACIQIAETLHGDAEIVDSLLFVDGVAV